MQIQNALETVTTPVLTPAEENVSSWETPGKKNAEDEENRENLFSPKASELCGFLLIYDLGKSS